MPIIYNHPKPTEQKLRPWPDYELQPDVDVPDPIALVSRRGDDMFFRGDIHMIEGQSGSKKTFLVSAVAAGVLSHSPEMCLGFHSDCGQPLKVMVVDTEQAVGTVQRVSRRIRRMAGLDVRAPYELLKVLTLRELGPRERLEVVKAAVAGWQPDVLIIDNVKDLMLDFNDVAEAQALVTELMRMSSLGCALIAVLHQNFGTDKARGHLGSLMYEKCATVATLKVEGERTLVDFGVKTRYIRPASFAFGISDEGLPVLLDDSGSDSPRKSMLFELVNGILAPGQTMESSDFVAAAMVKTGKSRKTIFRYLTEAGGYGFISNKDGIYSIPETPAGEGAMPF